MQILIPETYLWPCQTYVIEFFCKNNERLKAVNYFRHNTLSQIFRRVLDTPLYPWKYWKFIYLVRNVLETNYSCLRIHWRLSTILKTIKKSVWSNVFWHANVSTFWNFIQYTTHWDKTQMLQKFPSDKMNVTNKISILFFIRELQLIIVLFLIRDSSMSWSKTVCGMFHFRFCLVFIEV